MKEYLHKWLIKTLIKNSTLSKEDISMEKRTINFGLFGIGTMFLTSGNKLIIAILQKYYNYTCWEIAIKFTYNIK